MLLESILAYSASCARGDAENTLEKIDTLRGPDILGEGGSGHVA